MHVYVLTPVDCPKMMMTLEEFLDRLDDPYFCPMATAEQVNQELSIVDELFAEAGWEGDGIMRMAWIPPFINGGSGDGFGDFAYFVKQSNNGTCFVCTHDPLPINKDCDVS